MDRICGLYLWVTGEFLVVVTSVVTTLGWGILFVRGWQQPKWVERVCGLDTGTPRWQMCDFIWCFLSSYKHFAGSPCHKSWAWLKRLLQTLRWKNERRGKVLSDLKVKSNLHSGDLFWLFSQFHRQRSERANKTHSLQSSSLSVSLIK